MYRRVVVQPRRTASSWLASWLVELSAEKWVKSHVIFECPAGTTSHSPAVSLSYPDESGKWRLDWGNKKEIQRRQKEREKQAGTCLLARRFAAIHKSVFKVSAYLLSTIYFADSCSLPANMNVYVYCCLCCHCCWSCHCTPPSYIYYKVCLLWNVSNTNILTACVDIPGDGTMTLLPNTVCAVVDL